MTTHKNLLTLCVAAVLTLGLAACGGDGGDDPVTTMPDPPPDPGPTPYEAAKAAIAAATTAEAAQAAYNGALGDVTGAEAAQLLTALNDRIAELAAMARAAEQRMALMTAAGMIDTSGTMTAEEIAAANTAIAALEAAIAAAADVDDTSMYQTQVDAAKAHVMASQGLLDHAAQTEALMMAVTALQAIDLGDLSTQDKVDAAETAIAALQTALDNATELSAAEKATAMTELATANRTVMMAQGRLDVEGQKMVLSDAVDALEAIDLDNLMTQAQINAANAAIIALDLALEAATDLTTAEKLDATVDVTVAKRKVAAAETVLANNIDSQTTALTMAGNALAAIDLADLTDQAKIDAARTAVDALKTALDAATHLSDAEKAMYQSQYDTADETVTTAETGMDLQQRMMTQRNAITSAVTMARTAVAGVDDDSTDSEVTAADNAIAALKAAIGGADDLPEDDADVNSAKGTLATLEPQLAAAKRSRDTALAAKDEEDRKAMAATGKALRAALGGPEAGGNALANNEANPTLDDDSLDINAAAGAGSLGATVDPGEAELEAGDSAGTLGDWMGTDYAHSDGTGDAKVTNEARVYINKGPGKSVSFADAGHTIITTDGDDKGYVSLVAAGSPVSGVDLDDVMANAFTHSGELNHPIPDRSNAFYTRGTYDGAPGEYRCTGTCSSTNDGKGSPSALGGTWHFKPDAGANAMAHQPDAHYLYYGWWVSKDNDGDPTAASAFAGRFGTDTGDSADSLDNAWTGAYTPGTTLTGSATYAGNAAGKFAIDNPLDGTGNGGHFTADAMLNATFSGDAADVGITGTIDNFRLNDGTEDPDWSVSLHRAGFGADGAISAPTDVAATANVDEALGTTWSIGDSSTAGRSGTWSGQMYDELPGPAPDGDGSNIPTTATGTFYSEFSTIGRMVGAFGADKE